MKDKEGKGEGLRRPRRLWRLPLGVFLSRRLWVGPNLCGTKCRRCSGRRRRRRSPPPPSARASARAPARVRGAPTPATTSTSPSRRTPTGRRRARGWRLRAPTRTSAPPPGWCSGARRGRRRTRTRTRSVLRRSRRRSLRRSLRRKGAKGRREGKKARSEALRSVESPTRFARRLRRTRRGRCVRASSARSRPWARTSAGKPRGARPPRRLKKCGTVTRSGVPPFRSWSRRTSATRRLSRGASGRRRLGAPRGRRAERSARRGFPDSRRTPARSGRDRRRVRG